MSKLKFHIIVTLLLLILSSPSIVSQDMSLEARVDAFLKPVLDEDLISGSIIIAKGGEIVLAKGYGIANRENDIPNTPESKFRLGSMTKQFTAAAIMILEERGLLSVDDTLSKYYPDFPAGNKITLHHLLTHTSGIINFNDIPDEPNFKILPHSIDEVIKYFQDKPLLFEPGEKFAYSNSNYVLLSGIIEKVAKVSYIEFLKGNVFNKLGMDNTGQESHVEIIKNRPHGYLSFGPAVQHPDYRDMLTMSGAGSLYSTPMDMVRWDQALNSEIMLSKKSLDKMFTAYKENYGYGWFVEMRNGRKVVSHRGEISGFIGSIERHLDDSITVIVLFNFESTFARSAIRGLSEIALGREPKPLLVSAPPAIDPSILNSYAGQYYFGGTDTLKVNVDGARLYVSGLLSPDKFPAAAQSNVLFFIKGFNALIKFETGSVGEVTGLILVNSVQVYRAQKIL